MNYIGMDIQKRTSTAVVIDDNEKVLEQFVSFETKDEDFDRILENILVSFFVYIYSPERPSWILYPIHIQLS